ncbi:hypothetical protein B296_00031303 [Ensete ventricosum]|uniref:Uncharacterized protein n=1 Tax=Ensete ventricosum TaxID=4639 RepID=A0A426ZMH3_ENSVE|nr:hypothetical protein B296_00031303 [Ensete ventricosum]
MIITTRIGQGQVNTVGNSPGVHRELTEGIESLPGWRKGVRQKKTETRQKIIEIVEKLAWNDVVGSRQSSLGDSSEGIGKLAGNMSGDTGRKP